MMIFLSGDRMICGLDKICYSKGNLVNGFVCDCDCPFLRGLFTEQLDDLGGRMLRWTKEKSRSTYLGRLLTKHLTRATTFNHKPFTYKTSDGKNGGWESRIVESMAESLNFRCFHVL